MGKSTISMAMFNSKLLVITRGLKIPSGYLTVRHGKSPFLTGKLSISMGHLYHGYVSHNQRVSHLLSLASLWLFGPFIDGLPIKQIMAMLNNQMV